MRRKATSAALGPFLKNSQHANRSLVDGAMRASVTRCVVPSGMRNVAPPASITVRATSGLPSCGSGVTIVAVATTSTVVLCERLWMQPR